MMNIGPYELGTNDTPEYGIYSGDSRKLAEDIPDNSIDMIFTDPVYWNHWDYSWLAKLGNRVLKPGGNLIAQCGNPDLPTLLNLMAFSGLRYNRVLCEKFPVATQAYRDAMCFVGWKPYIWFVKDKRAGQWVFDAMNGGGSHKSLHEWQDSPNVFLQWIGRLTNPDAVILDLFAGSGTVPAVCKTLGRQYLAFEIDPNTASRARERVRNTQTPLMVVEFDPPAMPLFAEVTT